MTADASRDALIDSLKLFSPNSSGIEGLVHQNSPDDVFDLLGGLPNQKLTHARLNALLLLAQAGSVSQGFYEYYWLSTPIHIFDVTKLPGFQTNWLGSPDIHSLEHFSWGLYRLFLDCLLVFGDVETAYRRLRSKSFSELDLLFKSRRIDTEALLGRGTPQSPTIIPPDERYRVYRHLPRMLGRSTPLEFETPLDLPLEEGALRSAAAAPDAAIQQELNLEGAGQEPTVTLTIEEMRQNLPRFLDEALANTRRILSSLSDFDVYFATSMRSRSDFRYVANTCKFVVEHPKLAAFCLRYFDPTLAAVPSFEDKGMLECLLLKAAKVLVYVASDRDSYGKDAEAALALSLEKPVIFYCDPHLISGEKVEQIRRHPLLRVLSFSTGLANGAIVLEKIEEVVEILRRLLSNEMEFRLDRIPSGSLVVREETSGSIVRLQTADPFLREAIHNEFDY